MASENRTHNAGLVDKWLEEDNLMLLSCWSRDGYTYQDIANKIGITTKCLTTWRKKFEEIDEALKQGREIIDYKVENALLKSALGYQTKEVKVTTTIKKGVVVETIKEVTNKEQAPNVSAIQCWLYNRLPHKWKKNRDQFIELNDEESSIQISVIRGSKNEEKNNTEDKEWMEDVNQEIEIKRNEEYYEAKENKQKQKQTKSEQAKTKKSIPTKAETAETIDRDYWPDDWEEE